MSGEVKSGVNRFREVLEKVGLSSRIVEFSCSTRSSEEAAQAIGCEIGQIVKSLVFEGAHTHRPFLVLASGENRVNEKQLECLVGEPVCKGDAQFVREKTGFAIGGVPPLGHKEKIETFIDQDLEKYEEIWAAAGDPRSVFRLSFQELVELTGGRVISVK
ncbi:MAG TPA: YbaK/EbsC family protein [Candidatus Atribacteria bacterium]|nr:YbaK/EbsC family protein [Atribacterota bacterium]HOQ51882.1 YbaK/EbsC family protein [Candidatus Atribacteria bacterium]HPT63570.1 YbaK/EbsC family protein [Candidatus Atribacteria bacterium]HQD33088.1 YbaK/EbsC family protein [Candidatus Atribacteria bacterium]